MGYTNYHNILGKTFSLEKNDQKIRGTGIDYQTFSFSSHYTHHLPGSKDISNVERNFLSGFPDKDIRENIDFRYPVFLPEGYKQTNRAIILLHGLNEKSWDKYLPWARELVLRTGHAVILFPISFHMNRTPSGWTDPRSMNGLSKLREGKYEDQACSTFVNAAISERLDNMPERFALSGYQSILDLLNLVNHISSGKHPVFKEDTEIHFFGYSIGAFLSQVLMIANPNGVFDKSRFVLFAGGTVFSHINGISRFILDKQAFEQLRKYYLNQSSWKRKTLKSYAKEMDVKNVARAFMAMLSPEYFSALRESVFSKFSNQLLVYALKDDQVFPEEHILNNFNKSGVWVNRLDFPYNYSHEAPFPLSKDPTVSKEVDKTFDNIFREVGNFLRDESNYDFSGF